MEYFLYVLITFNFARLIKIETKQMFKFNVSKIVIF